MIEVLAFEKSHLPEAKAICDLQFGKDYLSEADLEAYLKAPNMGLVAVNTQGVVLGLTCIKIGEVADIAKELLSGADWLKTHFASCKKMALRKHLAVLPGQEGNGIGKKMMEVGMTLLEKQSVEVILSIVWKEGSSQALHHLLSAYQSLPIHTFEGYWQEDSLQKQYICPGCGHLPCNCSAILYAKMID